jgi:hypothetical protein
MYAIDSAFSPTHTVQVVDQDTFQTSTYNITVHVNSFSYGSSSPNVPFGSNFSVEGDQWLAQPMRLTGSYSVDGPAQDVSGSFDVTLQPQASDIASDFIVSFPDYPNSIRLTFVTTSPPTFQPTRLFSTTIDGRTLNYDLSDLQVLAFEGPNYVDLFNTVPEPKSCVFVTGCALAAFGFLRKRVSVN